MHCDQHPTSDWVKRRMISKKTPPKTMSLSAVRSALKYPARLSRCSDSHSSPDLTKLPPYRSRHGAHPPWIRAWRRRWCWSWMAEIRSSGDERTQSARSSRVSPGAPVVVHGQLDADSLCRRRMQTTEDEVRATDVCGPLLTRPDVTARSPASTVRGEGVLIFAQTVPCRPPNAGSKSDCQLCMCSNC